MRFCLSLLCALLAVCFATQAQAGKRYALVVGHNFGLPGESHLSFAEEDAERFAKVMTSIGGVDKRDLVLFSHPTRQEVLAGFQRILSRAAAENDGLVVFYFAGHGDDTSLHLGSERLQRTELISQMKRLPLRTKLAVIDACQTATVSQARGAKVAEGFDVGVITPDTPEGVVVIHSSDKGEPALESQTLRGALFTHHFLSGLRGAADADRDSRITLNEAYAYARRKTVLGSASGSQVIQHPSFSLELKGADELVLTETMRSRARLVLPAGSARYVVFQKTTAMAVAELEADPRTPQTIAVPAGRLLVQRTQGSRTSAAEVDAPFGGVHTLSDTDFVSQRYDVMAQRGGQLELWPNVLFAAAVGELAIVTSEPVWRLGPSLGYERRVDKAVLGLSASAGFSRYQGDFYLTQEQTLRLTGDIGWRRRFTPMALTLGLGPLAQLTWQQRHRLDAQRLETAGLSEQAEVRKMALGLGGRVFAIIAVPIHERVELRLGIDAALLGEKVTQKETSLEPILSVAAGAGLAFGL